MRLFKSNPMPALLLLIPLLIAACSGDQPAQEAAAEPTAASAEPTAASAEPTAASVEPTAVSDEPAAAGDEYALGDSYVIDGFGFSIDIPAGWHADTRGSVTIINELESDHTTAFQQEPPPREGYEIALDHRDASFMAGLGLGEDPSLQDLLELNREFFNWQEPIEVSETEAFGAPALAAKTFDGEDWGYALMGFANDEAFLLTLGAPSEEALDAFLPTLEQMVASIAPTAEQTVSTGDDYALDETYVFDGFGFSIAIPAGWHASTRGQITLINELESDHETAFREAAPRRAGYQLTLDHRDAAFMADLGLGEDPSLQDLFELNKGFFNWQEPVEVSETEAFGVPALIAKAFDGDDWGYSLMGFVNDEVFLLSLGAPSEQALDAFFPTLVKMVDSIAPAG